MFTNIITDRQGIVKRAKKNLQEVLRMDPFVDHGERKRKMCEICEKTVCPSACPNYREIKEREGVRASIFFGNAYAARAHRETREETDEGRKGNRIYRSVGT